MLDRRMSTALKGTGLTVRSFKFLHWADRLTDKSLARIKTNSDLSASEATLVVKVLSSAGYIKSGTANDDRRAVMIEVTPLGRKKPPFRSSVPIEPPRPRASARTRSDQP
jgi:DNA-binding MarR family transcriptional regulator